MIKNIKNIKSPLFSKKKETEQDIMAEKEKTAQNWMPVKDIYNQIMYRKDDTLAAAVKVQPINIHLLSITEQKVKINALFEALNGIDYPLQIFTIARPVDLDGYISKLNMMKQNEDDLRKRKLFDGSIQVAAQKATSGEALERDFYVVIAQENIKYVEAILLEKAKDLSNKLTSAGLISNVCTDQELRELNFVFTHPAQASIEKAPRDQFALPTFYDKEDDVVEN